MTRSVAKDDVFAEDADLCAYCAHRLEADDDSCPSCGKSLWVSFPRYATPSTNLHVLWVLLAGLAQLYLLSAALAYVNTSVVGLAAYDALIALLCLLMALGVYLRQRWAYLIVVPLLLIVLFVQTLGLGNVEILIPNGGGVMMDFFVAPILTFVAKAVAILRFAAGALAAMWAIFLVGPDFARDRVRLVASVERGLSEPSTFFATGQRFAERGMWATAILHWQRAAALNPTNGYYRQTLGYAYLKLGFGRRGLSLLRSSLPFINSESGRQQLASKIAELERSTSQPRVRTTI